MPRRGSSSPRRRASASPTRNSSSSTGGSTKKPETKQPAPAPQPAHAAPAPSPAPSGPGFFQRAAELGTGIAIGHVAGRALENVFFGGREASPQQLEKAEEAVKQGPCSSQYKGFMRCLEKNDDDAEQCDWAFDMFKECQQMNRSQMPSWEQKEQDLSM